MTKTVVALGVMLALSAVASGAQFDTSKSGVQTSEKWTYRYTLTGGGAADEMRTGVLQFDGKNVTGAGVSDRIGTPWGVMQYFGDKGASHRGWLLRLAGDKPIDETKGRLLDDPDKWLSLVGERAAKLKAEIGDLVVSLRYYGSQEKSYCRLHISTIIWRTTKEDPMVLHALVDHAAATKVIDCLAASGFLAHAEQTGSPSKGPAGPCYALTVSAGSLTLQENLGWDAQTAARLLDLRGALTGEAAKKMDQLLARMSGLIRKWTGADYKPPK